jgi:hypothetical protein
MDDCGLACVIMILRAWTARMGHALDEGWLDSKVHEWAATWCPEGQWSIDLAYLLAHFGLAHAITFHTTYIGVNTAAGSQAFYASATSLAHERQRVHGLFARAHEHGLVIRPYCLSRKDVRTLICMTDCVFVALVLVDASRLQCRICSAGKGIPVFFRSMSFPYLAGWRRDQAEANMPRVPSPFQLMASTPPAPTSARRWYHALAACWPGCMPSSSRDSHAHMPMSSQNKRGYHALSPPHHALLPASSDELYDSCEPSNVEPASSDELYDSCEPSNMEAAPGSASRQYQSPPTIRVAEGSFLRGSHIKSRTMVEQRLGTPQFTPPSVQSHNPQFVGHYILVIAYDEARDAYWYRDPGTPEQLCCVSAEAFDVARLAAGTDDDVIVCRLPDGPAE